MAYSKIKNVWTYFRNLDGALQAGCIDDPKSVRDFVEVDEDDGQIVGWIIPRRRVHFSQGSELSCTEEGVPAKAGQFHIPEYHFHFQPGEENAALEVFRLDLGRGEEAHFNTSEQHRTAGNHLKNGETPFDFSNFNCRLALVMSLVYMDSKIYPLDDMKQEYYEPVLSRKKDG